MNFDYRENDGEKALPANQKHQYHVSHYGENDCNANNQKNGHCYGYPSLSHFVDEFDYMDNGGKKAFLANPKINIV